MKFTTSAFLFFFSVLNANSQVFNRQSHDNSIILDPVEWSVSVEKQNDSIYHLIFKRDTEPNSEIHSDVHIVKNLVTISETIFQMNMPVFGNKTVFVQPLKIIFPEKPDNKKDKDAPYFHLETERILWLLTSPSL